MRQQGDDEESFNFRNALDNLRIGKTTFNDYQLLSTRIRNTLPQQEVATFADAIRILPKREDVELERHQTD